MMNGLTFDRIFIWKNHCLEKFPQDWRHRITNAVKVNYFIERNKTCDISKLNKMLPKSCV